MGTWPQQALVKAPAIFPIGRTRDITTAPDFQNVLPVFRLSSRKGSRIDLVCRRSLLKIRVSVHHIPPILKIFIMRKIVDSQDNNSRKRVVSKIHRFEYAISTLQKVCYFSDYAEFLSPDGYVNIGNIHMFPQISESSRLAASFHIVYNGSHPYPCGFALTNVKPPKPAQLLCRLFDIKGDIHARTNLWIRACIQR